MGRYLLRRLLLMVPTFFGITLLTFGVMHLAPGDPLLLTVDGTHSLSNEQLAIARARRGLDAPVPLQYARWLKRIVTLDFGKSSTDGRQVIEKIGEALPRTLLLSTLALLIGYVLAVPLGVYSAVHRGALGERIATLTLFFLYSMPTFWVAIMLLLVFSGGAVFELLPLQGFSSSDSEALTLWARVKDVAWHLVLPVACLTYGSLATISRYTRAGLLEVLQQDFLRTARAKGLEERWVIFRHALRNSLLPVVTLLGIMLPHLIGGSVIVEQIFGVPGMGLLAFEAILQRDYAMVMAVTTLVAVLTMVSLLATDALYALADPRIGWEARRA